MTRLRAVVASLISIVIMGLTMRAASAEVVCAQPPVVVPGLSGPPVWFQPGGGGAWRSTLQDPRWAGGPMRSFPFIGSGGNPSTDLFDAQYRFVYTNNSLYVSIQILADSDGPDGSDAVYFGITEGTGGSGAHLLEIPVDTGSAPSTCSPTHDPTCPIPNNPGLTNYFKTLNRNLPLPTWTAQSAPPSWLSNVASWTGSGPVVVWAVTLQIDTSTFTGATQMFFGTRISMAGGTIVQLSSSSQSTAANPPIGDTFAGESITDWLNFSALGAACPAGITISPSSIGVVSGTTITNAVSTCAGCTNKFRVEAQNVPAAATPYSVRTRIRVADWGSMIGDPNAPWIDFGIPPDVFIRPLTYFTTPPGSTQWAWSQSGGTADIDFTCALDGVAGHTFCPWVPNAVAANQQHQCILAEIALSPAVQGTAGWSIQTPAVFQNMEFGTLSSVHEPGTISIKNLQKVTGVAADRDVYVYLETVNMPAQGRSPMELPQQELTSAREYAMHPPPIPRGNLAPRSAVGAVGEVGLLSLPVLTGDQALATAYPTYRVFVYYDSGKTAKVKGQLRKILVPMTPFGLYLNHVGTFFGFNRSLEFLDGVAQEIAPNFYKIHMANESDLHVRTHVTAEEKPLGEGPPPPPPVGHGNHCNCDIVRSTGWSPWAVGLAAFSATVLAIRARRRRRGR